jgi:hypothetical protein
MAGLNLDEIEPPQNLILNEYLKKFKCEDLLDLAGRIMWLFQIKEVLGYIPFDFKLTYDEIRYLIVLKEEQNKKISADTMKSRREAEAVRSSSSSSGLGSGSGSGLSKYRRKFR